ncbi:hypothetical protein [Paractinoplanes ferrugineus]|uniref:hypothetical protein n=1 Tax=Paractinoplanes ferrugineus TaxID=113564 RepID=UPI001EF2A3F4|nr:hypothetical protein [Actinoplanes ferrugineus]
MRAGLREVGSAAIATDPGDSVEWMPLVMTELATNALRHGLPPTVVRLLREGDRLIIDVAERSHSTSVGTRPM